MNIDWTRMQTAEQRTAAALAEKRNAATLSKREFCLALAANAIISDAGCVAAAKGEWPDELSGFFAYLTPAQQRDVEIEWAGSGHVARMDTNILVMASYLALPDAAVDAMFGIV